MGEAKRRQAREFPAELVAAWESRDCVDFAVALARETGWILHIDWAANHDGGDPDETLVENMVPLRAYVADDLNTVFEIRGALTVPQFNERIVGPLARNRMPPHFRGLGVSTRFYDETELAGLPLVYQADERQVSSIQETLRKNAEFMATIPQRPFPRLPAKAAATYTWGLCAIYAQAMEDLRGVPATALIVTATSGSMQLKSGMGYVHSFCLNEDGTGEDSWGKQPVERMARKFVASEWHLDRDEHLRVVGNLKRNTPDRWAEAYATAKREISMLYTLD